MSQPTLVLVEFDRPAHPQHESYSPFCMKVHRALRYAGLAYSTRVSDPRAVTDLNPKGQLPVLLVDGTPVFDSTEIVRAVERLTPHAAESTPEARLWEELADGALYGYVVASRWADESNWPRIRDAYFAGLPMPMRVEVASQVRAGVVERLVGRDIWRGGPDECWARLAALLDDLEVRAPSTGYWLGDALSIADISLFAQLHGFRIPETPVQAQMVHDRPKLSSYLDRVHRATAETRAVSNQNAA
jgi:glutathione S-transferase